MERQNLQTVTGVEGAAAGLAFKAALAAGRRFTQTTEFDRLCQRLAMRFAELGWSDAQFKSWADSEPFLAAMGTYLDPPHAVDKDGLVAAITALVGPVSADVSGPEFAVAVAEAIPEELRFAKQGDSLVRSETDALKQTIKESATGAHPLRTAEDVFDRLSPIGSFLATRDEYFSYPSSTYEPDGPRHGVAPGSVMSVEQSSDVSASRIDIVPLSEEAVERYGPEFVVRTTGGEDGRQAAELLHSALTGGAEVEITKGVTVEFTRMPPAFAHLVGRRIAGQIRLGPAAVEAGPDIAHVWPTRIKTKTDRGSAAVDVDLNKADTAPQGWDVQLVGQVAGMSVTGLVRRHGGSGYQVRWGFSHTREDSPLRGQLEALRFLHAMSGAGYVAVATRGEARGAEMRTYKAADELDPGDVTRLAFLEDVLTIQEWANVEYQLPDEVSGDEVLAVAHIAEMIRRGGRPVRWHRWSATVPQASAERLAQGQVLRTAHTLLTTVLGRTVKLGVSVIETKNYVVTSLGPGEDPGRVSVQVEPRDEASGRIFQHLFRDAVPDRLPRRDAPPPPPRKRRKATSKGKRGKRR